MPVVLSSELDTASANFYTVEGLNPEAAVLHPELGLSFTG